MQNDAEPDRSRCRVTDRSTRDSLYGQVWKNRVRQIAEGAWHDDSPSDLFEPPGRVLV
jgi:hypothetical protein